jgi:hypothetical protein
VEQRRESDPELIVGQRQMLFAVPRDEDGREAVHYFTEDAQTGLDAAEEGTRDALSVIGAWADLDCDEALDELDRIRHESRPTPPIERI